ncbi:MAG: hypothetical protein KDB53_11130, partial [Planctomycetes bacterium]|nr:hypothetical protein [Planctomycetota bacterium]
MSGLDRLLDIALANALVATVLGCIVFLLRRPLRDRPALLHALWVLVLLKLVTPPLFEIEVSSPAVSARHTADAPVSPAPLQLEHPSRELLALLLLAAPNEPEFEPTAASGVPRPTRPELAAALAEAASWQTALVLAWLIGTFAILIVLYRRSRRFQRLVASGERPPRQLLRRLTINARRLGLARFPRVVVVDARISPALWGLG